MFTIVASSTIISCAVAMTSSARQRWRFPTVGGGGAVVRAVGVVI
jgi:hypothetical protein